MTAEAEEIVVEGAAHTVACYAAATVAMAEAGPATCGMEDSHVLGSEHQEACHLDPFLKVSCLEAYRCLAGGDASGPAEVAYAGSWEKGPCYSVE